MAVDAVVTGARRAGLGFWSGFSYPFRGMGFVYVRHRGLVRYWIWPILVVLTMIVLSFVVGVRWSGSIIDSMVGSSEGHASFLDPGYWIGRGFATVLVFGGLVLGGIALTILLSPVIAAPFNDLLSEEVERIVAGKTAPPFSIRRVFGDLARSIRIELGKLALYVLVVGTLFVLSLLVPPLGALVSIAGFFLTAVYFAVDYVDWPASRRGRGVRDRVRLVRDNLLVMLGFGCGVWLLLFLPVVQLFFMPAAVAGGTLLFLAVSPDPPTESGPSTGDLASPADAASGALADGEHAASDDPSAAGP